MRDTFEWAAGSTPGRDHRQALRNSQDSWHVEASAAELVAVVCDGCGGEAHSEVGAKLGARIVAKQAMRWLVNDPEAFRIGSAGRGMMKVRRSVLAQLQLLADSMAGPSLTEVVGEFFLFTVLGVIVRREETILFSAGDGMYVLNGARVDLKSKDNRPDYLSYGIARDGDAPIFQHHEIPTRELRTLILGTDGAVALADAGERRIPGKEERIGPLSQFLEDRYFKNPFALGHRLNLVNRDYMAADWEAKSLREEHGPMPDDTTLVVLRRRK